MDNHLDAFVCPAGTGGTRTGVGKVLKEHISNLHITVVEPKGPPILSGGKPGVGRSPSFIPPILNTHIYDEIIQITDEDTVHYFKELPKKKKFLPVSLMNRLYMQQLK